jgi:hypothetical protein
MMTVDEARVRLDTLGYTKMDTELLLEESFRAIQQAEVRLRQAEDKELAREAKALQKSAEEQQHQLKKTQAALKASTPPGKLVTWIERDIINDPFFVERMRAMGFDDAVIQEYLGEGQQRRAERREKLFMKATGRAPYKVKEESMSTLIKWYSMGIIDEDGFRNQALEINYLPDDIEQFFQEAVKAKEKIDAKAAKAAAKNGTAAGSAPNISGTP